MKTKKKTSGAKQEKKSNKLMKTVRFDQEVLKWVQQEAAIRGLPYQTLINQILREMMLLSFDKALHARVQEAIRDAYLERAKNIEVKSK
ncbi:MAG: hypothetical protein A2603_11830 [Bdellovibrionales bacterium RIFOXYD1_FULL_55_31]|nr:MAG: hypothetical protein A2603_11830 [Bdellovibrionales bacterium RIFOXYD1_FULL_55_31]